MPIRWVWKRFIMSSLLIFTLNVLGLIAQNSQLASSKFCSDGSSSIWPIKLQQIFNFYSQTRQGISDSWLPFIRVWVISWCVNWLMIWWVGVLMSYSWRRENFLSWQDSWILQWTKLYQSQFSDLNQPAKQNFWSYYLIRRSIVHVSELLKSQ